MSAPSGPEQVLYAGHTHAKILFKPVVIEALLLLAHAALLAYLPDLGTDFLNKWVPLLLHGFLIGLNLSLCVVPILRWVHSHFEVTDRRVRQRWGVLYKHSREIHLDRITQIAEERGVIDRIFGAGTIVIYDAANSTAIRFHDVPSFRDVRTILDDARHTAHTRLTNVDPAAWPGDPH